MLKRGDRVKVLIGRRQGMTGVVLGHYVPHGGVMLEILIDGTDEAELFRETSLMFLHEEDNETHCLHSPDDCYFVDCD